VSFIEYRDNNLYVEQAPVSAIAEEYGTPCYVYSLNAFRARYREIDEAFSPVGHLICFSIKCNSNLTVLRELAALGSGFDVVSGGELFRALEVGADPKKIVYAGVGKTREEIEYALKSGILMFNVESAAELYAINKVAEKSGVTAKVALRVNPDVDADTHKKITTGKKETKFGIDPDTSMRLARESSQMANLEMIGLHAHIGSQITKVDPFITSLQRVGDLIEQARELGAPIKYLNAGGGFGIDYKNDTGAPLAQCYTKAFLPVLERVGCKLVMEPGRYIAGNSGILVSRVVYVKETPAKVFYIIDGSMTELIRPTLYEAYHQLWPVNSPVGPEVREECEKGVLAEGCRKVDVVGPVCESGDFLAQDRMMPEMKENDLIAAFSAGAYGMAMASNYNSRPRPPELLVDGDKVMLVRRRETYEELVAAERV